MFCSQQSKTLFIQLARSLDVSECFPCVFPCGTRNCLNIRCEAHIQLICYNSEDASNEPSYSPRLSRSTASSLIGSVITETSPRRASVGGITERNPLWLQRYRQEGCRAKDSISMFKSVSSVNQKRKGQDAISASKED